jgi:hypothetical protein
VRVILQAPQTTTLPARSEGYVPAMRDFILRLEHEHHRQALRALALPAMLLAAWLLAMYS